MSDTTGSSKSKFKFSCTRCGQCCTDRAPIPLAWHDLEYWASKKIIKNMFPYIKIHKGAGGLAELVMNMISTSTGAKDQKKEEKSASNEAGNEDKKDDEELDETLAVDIVEKGKCPMYNKETKACLIWPDRPLYCRAFPLGYDDGSFVIEMEDCPGLGTTEEMNKDLLKLMRDDAKRLFEENHQISVILPLLQAVILNTLQEANVKTMSKMSPEDLQKLQEVFQKMSQTKK